MKRLVFIAALAVGGCSTDQVEWVFSGPPPKPFVAPDGRNGFSIQCGGSFADCYATARKACVGNYEVLGQNERNTYTPANQITGAQARTGVDRTMEVVCAG